MTGKGRIFDYDRPPALDGPFLSPGGKKPTDVCEECGKKLEFDPYRSRSHRRFCDDKCRYRNRDRRRYEENPEKHRARSRDYYARNRERVIARVRASQRKREGQ